MAKHDKAKHEKAARNEIYAQRFAQKKCSKCGHKTSRYNGWRCRLCGHKDSKL